MTAWLRVVLIAAFVRAGGTAAAVVIVVGPSLRTANRSAAPSPNLNQLSEAC